MSLGPAWSRICELGYIARPYLSKEEGKEMKGRRVGGREAEHVRGREKVKR